MLFVCLTFSSSVRVCVRRLMWWAQTVTCVSRASLTCRPVILKDVLSVFVLESQTCARAQSGSLARYIHTYTHTTFCRQNAIRKLYWLNNVTVVTSYLMLKWRTFNEWMNDVYCQVEHRDGLLLRSPQTPSVFSPPVSEDNLIVSNSTAPAGTLSVWSWAAPESFLNNKVTCSVKLSTRVCF